MWDLERLLVFPKEICVVLDGVGEYCWGELQRRCNAGSQVYQIIKDQYCQMKRGNIE